MKIREAPFALRVVQRRGGKAAVVYRRRLAKNGQERLDRIAAISPAAFTAAGGLLRDAVRAISGRRTRLATGPFHPLSPDWGARVASYALVARGLRNPERLFHAADHLRRADGAEAAWWLGLMENSKGIRAVRALRILVEAVR